MGLAESGCPRKCRPRRRRNTGPVRAAFPSPHKAVDCGAESRLKGCHAPLQADHRVRRPGFRRLAASGQRHRHPGAGGRRHRAVLGRERDHHRRRADGRRRPRPWPGDPLRPGPPVDARHRARRAELPPQAGAGGGARGGDRERGLQRPLFGAGPGLSVPHHQPPAAADPGARPHLVGGRAAGRRGDGGGGAPFGRRARLHHVPRHPLPGQIAGQDPGRAGRAARRRRDPNRGAGALLPAPPDPQPGGHAPSRRRGQVEHGRRGGRPRGLRPGPGRPHGSAGRPCGRAGTGAPLECPTASTRPRCR